MEVEGIPRLVAKLEAAKRGGLAGAALAVRLAGEDLLAASLPLTPKQEGTLRQSGSVDYGMGAAGPYARVGYGTRYAWAVHEMPNEETNWTTPGTGSKYLETPFAENKDAYAAAIMAATKKGLLV